MCSLSGSQGLGQLEQFRVCRVPNIPGPMGLVDHYPRVSWLFGEELSSKCLGLGIGFLCLKYPKRTMFKGLMAELSEGPYL